MAITSILMKDSLNIRRRRGRLTFEPVAYAQRLSEFLSSNKIENQYYKI